MRNRVWAGNLTEQQIIDKVVHWYHITTCQRRSNAHKLACTSKNAIRKVLKALVAQTDMSIGYLLEWTALHYFEGEYGLVTPNKRRSTPYGFV